MATTTPNLGLTKPTVGADADAWGTQLNASLDVLDVKVLDKTTGGTVSGPISVTNLSYSGSLTGGAGVINIGAGQVYKDAAGNVGIGTSSPAFALDIRAAASNGLRVGSNQNTFGSLLSWNNTSGEARLWSLGSFPLVLGTNGAESLRLDTAGNLGLGGFAPQPWGSNHKAIEVAGASTGHLMAYVNSLSIGRNYYETNADIRYSFSGQAAQRLLMSNDGQFGFFTAPSGTAGAPITFTQAMTLTQGGNLLVGTTVDNGNARIHAGGLTQNSNGLNITYGGVGSALIRIVDGNALTFGLDSAVGNTERARITSAGYFKASNTGVYGNVAGVGDLTAGTNHVIQSSANADTTLVLATASANNSTSLRSFLPTGSNGNHYVGQLNGTEVYRVLANGNVQNTNNSYGAISDAKLKTVTGDAPSYWDKYKKIHWLKYLLKADSTNTEMLGVVAQELEQIFPGLIERTPDTVEVTKTRTVTKTKPITITQQQTTTSTEIKFIDGAWREITTTKTEDVDVPVFDEFPLVDAAGNPVMEVVEPEVPAVEAQDEVQDEDGNVIQPAVAAQPAKPAVLRQKVHKVPRTIEYVEVEEYVEREPNGEFTLAVKYSVLGMIADVVTQEAQQRIEQLEQRLAALEAK